MDTFFENPGLCHIGKEITTNLDFKSLITCRLVCKSLNNHIEVLTSKISLEHLQQLLDEFIEARSMSESEKKNWTKFLMFISTDKETRSNKVIRFYLEHVFSRSTKYEANSKKTPLSEFVHYGNIKMVQFNIHLVQFNCDQSGLYQKRKNRSATKDMQSAHQLAINQSIQSGKLEMVKSLCDSQLSFSPRVSLHEAVSEGQLEILKFLVNSLSDPNILKRIGPSLMNLAMDNGHSEIITYLNKMSDQLTKLKKC